jgi:ABC-2 type transport system ATP-binding protein
MRNIIEVQDFTKKYGSFTAVDNISFTVEEGCIFAFLGPNGAGKSTTINTLCTIFEKTSGSLLIDGKDVTHQKNAVRSAIGVVFQEPTLDNKMTVFENLMMHCHFYAISKKAALERIQFVLDLVEMQDWRKCPASSLSGGMKRRVEIARSLLHFPKVLFLDEPTSGLDPQTRAHMWDYIVKLQRERNITIFLTTHYMDEAEISNKVAIIDHGKIVAIDTPYGLKKEHTTDRATIVTEDGPALEALLNRAGFNFKRDLAYFYVEIHNLDLMLDILSAHKASIIDLEMKKGTLNDVFLKITGREIRNET